MKMNSICESCKYAFYYSRGAHPGCNYINATGNTRDCAPGDGCTRYENGTPEELARERRDKAAIRAIKERNRKKKSSGDKPKNTIRREERKQMKKLTEENKREIIALRASGMKVTEIAQKFGVHKTSIFNILKDYKDHGESAFEADTDTEKEPAAAATVTDSEQEIVEAIPAPIVTPSEENVKSESEENTLIIPESVLEACRERRLNLQRDIDDFEASIADWKRQIKEIDDFIALAKLANPVNSVGGAV